jgi:Uma2 family endonuclease
MSTVSPKIILPSPVSTPAAETPALENGDHLTRSEFERRYEATTNVKKAELIEGVVFMPSPVRPKQHGTPHGIVMWWLVGYQYQTRGVQQSDNATVRLDLDNEPQPDGILYLEPAQGGRVKISDDAYIEGAPELVVEISASTVSMDLHEKFRVYRRNQVQEYIVWRVLDREIDWFVLRNERYEKLALSPAGFYQSEIFPGLWLDPAALIASDLGRVLQALQQGIATPEHAAFVQRLAQAASRMPPANPPS